jgi:hypothetical protein
VISFAGNTRDRGKNKSKRDKACASLLPTYSIIVMFEHLKVVYENRGVLFLHHDSARGRRI